MSDEICGICKCPEPMKKIQSKKGFQLYKCRKCGSVKDLGLRVEDKLHKEYEEKGEPEHSSIQETPKVKKILEKNK